MEEGASPRAFVARVQTGVEQVAYRGVELAAGGVLMGAALAAIVVLTEASGSVLGLAIACAIAVMVWKGLHAFLDRARRVSVDDDGVTVDGKLVARYPDIQSVTTLFHGGKAAVRLGLASGSLLLVLRAHDAPFAADIARAIDERTSLHVRTFGLRRRIKPAIALLALGAWLAWSWFAGAHDAWKLVAAAATGLVGLYLAGRGLPVDLAVGNDGAVVKALGVGVATLPATGGIDVSAEGNTLTLRTSSRALELHTTGFVAATVAEEVREALSGSAALGALEITPPRPGQTEEWVRRARRSTESVGYRGRQLTADDLRRVVRDGRRPAFERIYAAIALVAHHEDAGDVARARDTSISPRLRVSLEATLAGDDRSLAAELDALAAEEADREVSAAASAAVGPDDVRSRDA